jgi:hypothetical protein
MFATSLLFYIDQFFMLRFSKENLEVHAQVLKRESGMYLQQEMACCEVTILTSQALPTSNSVIKLSGKARN